MKTFAFLVSSFMVNIALNAQTLGIPKMKDSCCVYKDVDQDGIELVYVNKSNALIGDMILSESRNQINARNSHGLIFARLEVKNCEEVDAPISKKKEKPIIKRPLLRVTRTLDKIIVKTILSYNC